MWCGVPMMDYWGAQGVYGWLPMLLLLILIFIGFALFMGYFNSSNKKWPTGKTPLDVLKERYAKGEIDKNQFDEMKKNLS